jgi:hypothetical protein
MEKNPSASPFKAWEELKKENYPGGVKLTTKELRDYFGTQVSTEVSDPNTVKSLMRHTSLTPTSKYIRTVPERMRQAVQNLGKPLAASLGDNSGGKSIPRTTQSDIMRELAVRLIKGRDTGQIVGGGGGSRTHDAADMSHANSDSNLLDLLAEILLEATDGGNPS